MMSLHVGMAPEFRRFSNCQVAVAPSNCFKLARQLGLLEKLLDLTKTGTNKANPNSKANVAETMLLKLMLHFDGPEACPARANSAIATITSYATFR